MTSRKMIGRIEQLEKLRGLVRRHHFIWQGLDDTGEQVQQEIDRRIAKGTAALGDKFHIVGWRRPK